LRTGVRQAKGQAEFLRQVQEDVEELGLELDGVQMGVEMAHVEAPVDGTLQLSAAFTVDLVQVGVVPTSRPRFSESRRLRRATTVHG